jgi:hypothetical protein
MESSQVKKKKFEIPFYVLIALWLFPVLAEISRQSGIENIDLYFSHPLVLYVVFIEAIGFTTLLAFANIIIALFWKKYRNIKSCKNICLFWIILSIAQAAVLAHVDSVIVNLE